jgi:hypothetical protein
MMAMTYDDMPTLTEYQSLTQSRYSHNNHYDHKMTQMPINVLTNDNTDQK